jgi:hypothetical protein
MAAQYGPDDPHDPLTLVQTLDACEPDWAVAWLISHADSELWAPRQYIIVDELTRGSPTLAATWRAIYRLWLLHRPTGRTRFGLREIARVGGVGAGRVHIYVRELVHLGLITVEPSGDDTTTESRTYGVDVERLEALSVKLIRSRLTAGQLVAKSRSPQVYQQTMFAALDLVPEEALLTLSPDGDEDTPYTTLPVGAPPHGDSGLLPLLGLPPHGDGHRAAFLRASPHGDSSTTPFNTVSPHGDSRLSPPGDASPHGDAHPSPSGAAPIAIVSPLSPDGGTRLGDRHHVVTDMRYLPPSGGAITCEQPPSGDMRPQAVTAAVLHAPHDPGVLSPSGDSGTKERTKEGMKEGESEPQRAEPARSPTHTDLESMINHALAEQLPLLAERLGAMLGRTPSAERPYINSALSDPADDDPHRPPPAPPGEPALPRPLLAIWEHVTGAPVSDTDRMQIAMFVERYRESAQGYSAYWLGRAMLYAQLGCTDQKKSVQLRSVNTFMQRMARPHVGFSTAALENKSFSTTASAHDEAPLAEIREHSPEPASSPVHNGTEPDQHTDPRDDPADNWEAHPIIAAWRTFAGRKRALMPARAQFLIARVTDVRVWHAVLTNWREQYGAKANWTHFEALVERYDREIAAGLPDGRETDQATSALPSTILYFHPALAANAELRRIWTLRHGEAPTKQAKRAVIDRLLSEFPLPDPLPEALAVQLGLVPEPAGSLP